MDNFTISCNLSVNDITTWIQQYTWHLAREEHEDKSVNAYDDDDDDDENY